MMWVLHDRGVHTELHYLDDFLVLGPPGQPICEGALSTAVALCEELGFSVAEDKTEDPTTVLTFLGIELDTLQQHKLLRLTSTIANWIRHMVQK